MQDKALGKHHTANFSILKRLGVNQGKMLQKYRKYFETKAI